MLQDIEKILITREQIARRIHQMGDAISRELADLYDRTFGGKDVGDEAAELRRLIDVADRLIARHYPYAWNDCPQPQEPFEFGFLIANPAPVNPS